MGFGKKYYTVITMFKMLVRITPGIITEVAVPSLTVYTKHYMFHWHQFFMTSPAVLSLQRVPKDV